MPATLSNPNNRSTNPVHHSHACYVTRHFNQYHTKCYFTASTWNYDKFVCQDLKEPKHCSKRRGHALNRLIFHFSPDLFLKTNIEENSGKVIRFFYDSFWVVTDHNFSNLDFSDLSITWIKSLFSVEYYWKFYLRLFELLDFAN